MVAKNVELVSAKTYFDGTVVFSVKKIPRQIIRFFLKGSNVYTYIILTLRRTSPPPLHFLLDKKGMLLYSYISSTFIKLSSQYSTCSSQDVGANGNHKKVYSFVYNYNVAMF